MGLLEVVEREPGLLVRVTHLLDLNELARLEMTCTAMRRLFQECRIWRRRVVRWSETKHLSLSMDHRVEWVTPSNHCDESTTHKSEWQHTSYLPLFPGKL